MMLLKKEWKLVMMPVPLLFLLLSALVLVPNYPYYVTFFYTTLGIFLMMQFARENRDLYYMALLPVTKCEMVKARFSLVLTIEAMQVLACVPFLLLRCLFPCGNYNDLSLRSCLDHEFIPPSTGCFSAVF